MFSGAKFKNSILSRFFFLKYSNKMHSVSCRFYKQQYPEIDDVVMVNVRSIAEMGAYVHLLEYDNIEGNFNDLDEFS